jgi:hypothetical protein
MENDRAKRNHNKDKRKRETLDSRLHRKGNAAFKRMKRDICVDEQELLMAQYR